MTAPAARTDEVTMTRRDDDESPEPPGGKAEARLRQFLEARGIAPDEDQESDEDDDSGQAEQDTTGACEDEDSGG